MGTHAHKNTHTDTHTHTHPCVLYHTPHTQLRQLPWYGHIQLQVLLFRFHGFIFFPLSRSLFSLFFVCPFFLLFSFFFPQGIPLLFWAWRLFIYFRWSATPTGLYEREEFASCYCFTSPSLVPPSSSIPSALLPPLPHPQTWHLCIYSTAVLTSAPNISQGPGSGLCYDKRDIFAFL